MPTLADVRNFARYHLKRRPVDHPAQETELGVTRIGYDSDAFYASLEPFEDRYAITTEESVSYRGVDYPLRLARRAARGVGRAARTLLVLAGVHGNEQAGLLAVPPILDAFAARHDLGHVELAVLGPVNPVGAAHTSRYNGDGFDINRDFVRFETREARAVRRVFERLAPDFIVSLHEGPQDATFLFANRWVDERVGRELLTALEDGGTTLAERDYFGRALVPPGYAPSTPVARAVTTLWAKTLEMQATSSWAEDLGVPEITIESSWRSADRGARVRAHVDLVMATLAHLERDAARR
ncbi:MAG: DUF2817 domain-containing protein [Sandaracinaceae bacterium]